MPFTVLHVCMGNICRSPMAERLLALAAADPPVGAGGRPELYLQPRRRHRRLARRRADEPAGRPAGHAARRLTRPASPPASCIAEHDRGADLVLLRDRRAGQRGTVAGAPRRRRRGPSCWGSSAGCCRGVDLAALPPAARPRTRLRPRAWRWSPRSTHCAGCRPAPPLAPDDDLDDPCGRARPVLRRTADEIERPSPAGGRPPP